MTAVLDVPRLKTPLSPDKEDLLDRLVVGLGAAELQWLSGFTAGLAASGQRALVVPPHAPAPQHRAVTILFGTQTGNSRAISERLKAQLEASGVAARLVRASDYATRDFKDERVLFIVISTQGDGDPPDDARGVCEFLLGARAPKVPNLQFSVLGLGDSSYPKFCHVARLLDERLAALGATRITPKAECDVDFEATAQAWSTQSVERVKLDVAPGPALHPTALLVSSQQAPTFTKEHPFGATVLANQRITGRDARKDVRHVELSLEGSGLRYEPGDALGVWPVNPPSLVQDVAALLGSAPDVQVGRDAKTQSLETWLGTSLEITRLSRPFLEAHAARAHEPLLKSWLLPENSAQLATVLSSWNVADVLRLHPASWTAAELVGALRKLTPRLYSIASSLKHAPDEVHLTVARVDYLANGKPHLGSASNHLATLGHEDAARVFVEPNDRFRLPKDASTNIIMVGPGTGVAPFRAFVQERQQLGGSGKNWLFFGEQHFRSQFLYQVEWQEALKKGVLARLDVAFSRDQAQKVYVQDRIREHGRQVFDWLQNGAHLYVCGDAKHMAPDVEKALESVAVAHGALSADQAVEWLANLRDQKRYLRDVY